MSVDKEYLVQKNYIARYLYLSFITIEFVS